MTTSYTNRPPPINMVVSSSFDKAAYRTYETVKSERDALKETDKYYKKRIETLEDENRELLKSYQGLYAENKHLMTKLEHGPDAQRIKNFRAEIKQLEEKVEKFKSQNSLLENEIEAKRKEFNTSIEDKKRINEAMKTERLLNHEKMDKLEQGNKEKEEKLEKLEKQVIEYEMRIKNHEDESDGLLNRYKDLKAENIKLETKFKKQKNLLEEELRETKLNNRDMAKELIAIKTKLAKLESEYNTMSIDFEAAQKQVEYQTKELEIFKTQQSKLQRNMTNTNRHRERMEDEIRSYETIMADVRKQGTEAIVEERQKFRRREEKLMKRIEDLELEIEDLNQENRNLTDEAKANRMKMESAILEKADLEMNESALKRRLQVLEQANIDLDRQTRFKQTRSLPSRLPKKAESQAEQEVMDKIEKLEYDNWKLSRRLKQMERDESGTVDIQESVRIMSRRTRDIRSSVGLIRAEMPSLAHETDGTSYARRAKTPSVNLPAIKKN